MRRPFVLAVVFSACATAGPARPELGDRIRVRIEGRGHEKSITTADYFLYLVLRSPDGRLAATRIYAPDTIESEGAALILGKRFEGLFDLPKVELAETRHGDPRCAHDVVLPPGYSLCFDPDTYFAYRIADGTRTMHADRAAEIRLGVITADGAGYVELEAADGPPIERATDPHGWPPAPTDTR